MTEINTKSQLAGGRAVYYFRGVELEATEKKSSKWQGRGLEPGTTSLQVQHPYHWPRQATPYDFCEVNS